MAVELVEEQIQLYAKQLKIPTFSHYEEVLRRTSPDQTFAELLLFLLKAEYEQRQENKNQRRLKQAGFPYTKTLDELDVSRYSSQITEMFMMELASCRFIDDKKNRIRLSVRRLSKLKEREALKEINKEEKMTLGDILKDQLK